MTGQQYQKTTARILATRPQPVKTALVFSELDKAHCWQRINTLPFRFRRQLAKITFKEAASKPVREVRQNLEKRLKNINETISPALDRIEGISFAWWEIKSKEAARETAGKKAAVCHAAMVQMAEHATGEYSARLDYVFGHVVSLIAEKHPEIVTPPAETDEQKECALLRMASQKWWDRKLQRIRKRHFEYQELTALAVGKASPYASKESVAEFVRDQLAFKAWAAGNEMVSDQGDTIEMQKAIGSGLANPENMRVELMKRIAGLEDYAEEIGASCAFLTLTAPSKYHRKRGDKANGKWNGASPKDTQAYMVKLWGRVRAAIARAKVDGEQPSYFGVRVVEPHKDGTPHWHMLLWGSPVTLKLIKKICFKYYTEEDSAELWARWHKRHHRNTGDYCRISDRKLVRGKVFVDYKRACAIYRKRQAAEQKKKEVGKPYRDYKKPSFKALLPWSPRFLWEKITFTARSESTGDYCCIKTREVIKGTKGRRKKSAAAYIAKYISKNLNSSIVDNMVCDKTGQLVGLSLAHVKAWASIWGIHQFQFQGCDPIGVYRELRRVRSVVDSADIERVRQAAESDDFIHFIKAIKTVNAQLDYEVTPFGNEYGEAVKKVKGVSINKQPIITRCQGWTVRRKALPLGRAAQSWSSGNNCTAQLDKFHNELFDPASLAALGRGCTVNISGQRWRQRNNQPYEIRH